MGSNDEGSVPDPSLGRLVAASSPDLHTVATVEGVVRHVSGASFALFGWEPEAMVGQRHDAFVHPDDLAVVAEDRRQATEHPGTVVTNICRFRCADGTYRWSEERTKLVDAGGEQVLVSAIRDVGDRGKSQLDLERQASTDPLTGVANRTVFMDRLQQGLRRLDRREGIVAVLFLDLDGFKMINDSVGHLVGDSLLQQMAERISESLRPHDTLARLGGDEFAVVVEDMSEPGEAAALGTRIVAAGRTPFEVGNVQFICTTSIGIAVTSDPRRDASDLLHEADLALYRAKGRGRDRVEMYDEELRRRAVGKLGTEKMLRQAIDEDRLRVAFQPIIDLRTSNTVAAEALVRVWDPVHTDLVAAESFIDVAEETDLLSLIDDWMLTHAIEQATSWRPMLSATDFEGVAINVTARHLAETGFARSIIDLLAAHRLPARALQVEVTERVLMEASSSAMSGLKLLHDTGIRVGLDDFGTGYSSLSFLRVFPLDYVKIDQVFIRELAAGAAERPIVGSIIELAHALDIAVIAEGVETRTQLDQLLALGCDRAQGFLLGMPGPPGIIEARVGSHADSDRDQTENEAS